MANKIEVQHCTFRVSISCTDDIPIPIIATAISVENISGSVNFIIIIEDTREIAAIENELNEAKIQSERLMSQLIPPAISSFVSGRANGFSFIVPKATIVAVRVTTAFEMIEGSFVLFNEILSHLEAAAGRNQPTMHLKTVSETVFFVGDLFNQPDDPAPAIASIKFALEAKEILEEIIKSEQLNKFTVSVATGGPFVCGLVGDDIIRFDAVSPVIDYAAALACASQPNMVVVTKATKETAGESNGLEWDIQGMKFRGDQTYLF